MSVWRTSSWLSFALLALAISLVVNFSYLLLLVVNPSETNARHNSNAADVKKVSGRLSVSVDGYGYLVSESGDSIYVERRSIRWLELKTGDVIEGEASPQEGYERGHLSLKKILVYNGAPFDSTIRYDRPGRTQEMLFQILYYILVAFILLSVNLPRSRQLPSWKLFAQRATISIIITVVAYFLAPVVNYRTGETILVYQGRHLIDFVVMLKCLFTLVVILLYSQIYALVYQRQQMGLENEQLKNENLTTRYNMLVSQINPHFFFNSLNSLSMLVREKDDKRALEYINQLSYTFRYITQNSNNSELVALSEEMHFADAYCYLFRIRYADKIFFDVAIDEKYMAWRLPALSLQPLIGNAVKHNTITAKNPFHVRIYTENDYLIVANERRPLLEEQIGTGTGLENLRNRYNLMLGCDIEVVQTEKEFMVKLPLKNMVA